MINLGNVVGVLRSTTPPNKKYVLWAKILNPLFPDVVELNYWDEINLAWVPLTDSTTQHWLRPVLDIRASPPLSPIEGDRYLISPTGASGAFLAKENQVATYRNSSWQFQIPLDGYIVSVRTEANKLYDFRGTYGSGGAWYENDFQVPIAPGTYIPSTEKGLPNGVVPLGPDTKIDSTYLNANTLPFTPVNSGQWPIGTDTVREGLEYLRSVVSGAVYIPNLNEVLGSGNNAGNQFLVNVQGIGVGILSPTAKVHFRGTGAGTNPLFRLENSSIVDLYTMLENGVSTYAAVVKYASDISGTFDNLSLVHKQYVDAAVAGATPGLIQLDWQITPPVGISNKTTVWADSSGRINWRIGTGGSSWIRTFDATGITANRVYSFPDQSGTLAIAANHWSLATGAVLTGPNTIIMGSNPIVFTGNRVSFTPNLSTAGVNVGEFAGIPLSLLTGDIWVQNDGSANRFMGRINGDTRAFLTMQVGDLSNSLFRIPYLVNINTARMNTSDELKFDGFTLILGGGTATASTILDIKSTTRAVALPRMTTAQRDAIPNPSAGMLIFNLSTGVYNFHNGTVWGPI